MKRAIGDYKRDYHIEIYPICAQFKPFRESPPKLPDRTSAQHPESDLYFMAVTILMEECANIRNGCDGCQLFKPCSKLQSALSEKGSDITISEQVAHEFINKFLKMVTGVY